MNKEDLELVKKIDGRVAYNPRNNGHRYVGRIKVLHWTGNPRCWFVADIVDGKTICVPLVKLTAREIENITNLQRSVAEVYQMSKLFEKKLEQGGSAKKGDSEYIAQKKIEHLFLSNIATEKAPLREFALL